MAFVWRLAGIFLEDWLLGITSMTIFATEAILIHCFKNLAPLDCPNDASAVGSPQCFEWTCYSSIQGLPMCTLWVLLQSDKLGCLASKDPQDHVINESPFWNSQPSPWIKRGVVFPGDCTTLVFASGSATLRSWTCWTPFQNAWHSGMHRRSSKEST